MGLGQLSPVAGATGRRGVENIHERGRQRRHNRQGTGTTEGQGRTAKSNRQAERQKTGAEGYGVSPSRGGAGALIHYSQGMCQCCDNACAKTGHGTNQWRYLADGRGHEVPPCLVAGTKPDHIPPVTRSHTGSGRLAADGVAYYCFCASNHRLRVMGKRVPATNRRSETRCCRPRGACFCVQCALQVRVDPKRRSQTGQTSFETAA